MEHLKVQAALNTVTSRIAQALSQQASNIERSYARPEHLTFFVHPVASLKKVRFACG
jgi:hypothetical protein